MCNLKQIYETQEIIKLTFLMSSCCGHAGCVLVFGLDKMSKQYVFKIIHSESTINSSNEWKRKDWLNAFLMKN